MREKKKKQKASRNDDEYLGSVSEAVLHGFYQDIQSSQGMSLQWAEQDMYVTPVGPTGVT